MANAPIETVPLRGGLSLSCSYPELDEVQVSLNFRNHRLHRWHFSEEKADHLHSLDLGWIHIAVRVEADVFDGEFAGSCTVDVRNSLRSAWRRVFDGKRRVLVRFDPTIGMVDDKTAAWPPQVDGPNFGPSQPCTLTVLRFHVDEEKRDVCKVGNIVKKVMFPDLEPFVFNTVACVGKFQPGTPGQYTDPSSPYWFNIFLGYYQLDCPKPAWTRPFGYESADDIHSKVKPDELVRLGKADWNWFSNWCYGVPCDALMPYSTVPPGSVNAVVTGLVQIGKRHWHHVRLEGTEVASCYESNSPCARKLVENTDLQAVWRRNFGAPSPRAAYPTSFIPVEVDAVVDMAYYEDEAGYHTVIFGGTARTGTDPDFLDAQLAATRAMIVKGYPLLGFN